MVNVIVSSIVEQIWVDEGHEDDEELPVGVAYGGCTHDGGEVVEFQCADCGQHVADDETELYEALKGMEAKKQSP
jgi:hypothetical protein